ncbi:MAG: hypothetical protein JST62_09715, partial [Bacteroidetes bacterium]|nr:hypothetical protein [Bacteroidota bacterium]
LNTVNLETDPTQVEWHATNDANSPVISNVSAMGPGTYYAFYTVASGKCRLVGSVVNVSNYQLGDPEYGNCLGLVCYNNGWNNVQATSIGAVKSYTIGSKTFTATYTLNSGTSVFYPNYTPGGIFGTMTLDMAGVRNGVMTTTFSTPVYSMDLGWDDFDMSETTSFQFYDQNNNLIPTTTLQTTLVFSGAQTTISYPVNGTIKVMATNSGNISGADTQIRFNFPGTIGISKIVATAVNPLSGDNDMFLIGGCIAGNCYKPATLDAGNTYPTQQGITALGRAGANNSNWPMVRQSAWTALESKEKGFVVNRVATTAALANITNPVEGMMVYDIEAKCLKVYTIKEGDTNPAWWCMTTSACPD